MSWRAWRLLLAVALIFGMVIAFISYADGRWFDDKLPGGRAMRTARGALILVEVGVVVLGLLVALLTRRSLRRVASDGPACAFGFAERASFEAGQPDWESDEAANIGLAEVLGQGWLHGQGAEACVEVVLIRGKTGRVAKVLTQDSSEDV